MNATLLRPLFGSERPSLPGVPIIVEEIDPGTVDGVYDISDGDGGSLGTLVATGAQPPSGWTAGREYWFWTGSPFPSGGFRLASAGSSIPGGLTPSNAYVYTSGPFPTSTTSYSVTSGNWFRMDQGSGSQWTTRGWVKVKTTENRWYELGNAQGQTTAWIVLTESAPLLRFVSVPAGPPNLQLDAALVDSDLVSSPG